MPYTFWVKCLYRKNTTGSSKAFLLLDLAMASHAHIGGGLVASGVENETPGATNDDLAAAWLAEAQTKCDSLDANDEKPRYE